MMTERTRKAYSTDLTDAQAVSFLGSLLKL